MGRRRLYFEPGKLLNLDLYAALDPDPAFHSNADPDPASKNNADQAQAQGSLPTA